MAPGGLAKVHFVGFLRSVCIFWLEVSSSETKSTWNKFPVCQRCRLLWKSGLLFLVFLCQELDFQAIMWCGRKKICFGVVRIYRS